MANDTLTLNPIGVVRKNDERVFIDIFPAFRAGLLGLDQFSHVYVFYWFSENDHAQGRSLLQVHPCGNESNPLTGVFATHSPRRPNLIAQTVCKLLAVKENGLVVDDVDAFDGSPVIDVKSYFPAGVAGEDVRVPQWLGHKDEET